jgi:hypothetical protein
MIRSLCIRFALLAIAIADAPAAAQSTAQAAEPRALGPVVATSTVSFGTISQLVTRPDGKVLVNDNVSRRLLLLDAALANPVVVFDSVGGKTNSYTTRPLVSFLTAFRADSALFFDAAAAGFVVIHPDGTVGRTGAAPPTGSPGMGFTNIPQGIPVFSQAFGLVYRGGSGARAALRPLGRSATGAPDSVRYTTDSVFIHRGQMAARAMDTVARISTGTQSRQVSAPAGGVAVGNASGLAGPFPFYDDVVVTTDGAIGIFHALDFRFDWTNPDGTRTAGPRMPFPWRRITDADRQRLLDSINASRTRAHDSLLARRAADPTGGRGRVGRAGVSDAPPVARGPAPVPRLFLLTPAEVPDFYPPTASRGSVLADGDNRVWIRPRLADANPLVQVWYVYDRAGTLVDRVRLPEGRTIAGFGAGVVYLVARDAGAARIEKVRIR